MSIQNPFKNQEKGPVGGEDVSGKEGVEEQGRQDMEKARGVVEDFLGTATTADYAERI